MCGAPVSSRRLWRNGLKCFNVLPDITHLVVMIYMRFPLSLHNVEDLLHDRGIDITRETVRFGDKEHGRTPFSRFT